jgi:hypothetical protein
VSAKQFCAASKNKGEVGASNAADAGVRKREPLSSPQYLADFSGLSSRSPCLAFPVTTPFYQSIWNAPRLF